MMEPNEKNVSTIRRTTYHTIKPIRPKTKSETWSFLGFPDYGPTHHIIGGKEREWLESIGIKFSSAGEDDKIQNTFWINNILFYKVDEHSAFCESPNNEIAIKRHRGKPDKKGNERKAGIKGSGLKAYFEKHYGLRKVECIDAPSILKDCEPGYHKYDKNQKRFF